jgi:hypothetical protein
VGLVLYGARQRVKGTATYGDMSMGRFLAPVKRWLQDFF